MKAAPDSHTDSPKSARIRTAKTAGQGLGGGEGYRSQKRRVRHERRRWPARCVLLSACKRRW
jgi:hypothetical protein